MDTKTKVLRAHRKLLERVTRYDGYQPWGYDLITLKLTKPGYWAARTRLAEIYKSL